MSSSSGITSPVKAAIQGRQGNSAQIVQIIKLPQGLENSSKTLRLEGQITSQDAKNNTARIVTERGEIDVKIKGNRQPQVGQKIEIEIPANRPQGRQLRQATIRTDALPQNTHQPDNTQRQTPSPQQQGNLIPPRQNIRSGAQSLPPALQETLSAQRSGNATPPTRAITPEALVRLLSVSPAQAQNIAKEFIQSLPPPVLQSVNKTAFQPTATTQNLAGQATLPASALTQSAVNPILNNGFIGQAQPAFNTAQHQTTLLQSTALNTPSILSASQTVQSSITFSPTNSNINDTSRLSRVDIHILKTAPANVTLAPPAAPNTTPPSPIPAATQIPPMATGANMAGSLSAQVTGFTAQGLPLITIQGLNGALPQSFVLQQAGNNLQLGTQLQISPKNAMPLTQPLAAQTLNNTPLLQGFQWPAVDELYSGLLKVSPQAAASLTRTLPNAGNPAQMGAAAMVFIAAIKSGQFDLLLGDKKLDLLQQIGRRSILSGLTQDAARAAPEAAPSNEWRAVPLPMFWDNEIHKITLYTRHENQDNEQDNQNKDGQTRFIFDLNLTRMGDVQIDGLIKNKRLDLILRTQNAFSPPMQQTMRHAYSHALDQTALSGELTFQGTTQHWVHVQQNQKQLGLDI